MTCNFYQLLGRFCPIWRVWLAFVVSLGLALTVGSEIKAQETEIPGALRITDRLAAPGALFSVFVVADLDVDSAGFQAGIRYPFLEMEFLSATTSDTVFARTRLEVFEVDHQPGEILLTAIEDQTPPVLNFVKRGTNVRLIRLDFKLALSATLGESLDVKMENSLGSRPLITKIFSGEDSFSPVSLGGGTVQVAADNYLRISDVDGVRLDKSTKLQFNIFNREPLEGISIAVEFDPNQIRFNSIDIGGTIAEAFGAEYFAPVIDNEAGYCTLGILMDFTSPFESQKIPATGFETPVANAEVVVLDADPETTGVDLKLSGFVGDPPVGNLFVVDFGSKVPVLQSGRLSLLVERPFIRGDINEDGMVDIADAVWILQWLFLRGVRDTDCQKAGDTNDTGAVLLDDILLILQYQFWGGITLTPPFPEPGFDPTPDDLFCHFNSAEFRS